MSSDDGNLFLRKEEESPIVNDSYDEKWDDSELVEAYDLKMYEEKKKLLKKVQLEMGLSNEDVEGIIGDMPTPKKPVKKSKKKKAKPCTSKSINWKIGDACRAVYSEDGEEYEADIIRNIDSNWCVVRFVGYENEEEVLLKELMPSLGKSMRKLQTEMANEDLDDEQGEQMESSESEVRRDMRRESQSNSQGEPRPMFPSSFFPANFRPGSHQPPPPPPPMPPTMMFNSSHPAMGGLLPLPKTNDANLDAMLMSWYMCGYYTGYYAQGVKS